MESNLSVLDNQEELIAKRKAERCLEKAKTRMQYRKIVQAGIARWIEKFQAGEIKIETVSDLRELVEMDLSLEDT